MCPLRLQSVALSWSNVNMGLEDFGVSSGFKKCFVSDLITPRIIRWFARAKFCGLSTFFPPKYEVTKRTDSIHGNSWHSAFVYLYNNALFNLLGLKGHIRLLRNKGLVPVKMKTLNRGLSHRKIIWVLFRLKMQYQTLIKYRRVLFIISRQLRIADTLIVLWNESKFRRKSESPPPPYPYHLSHT